MLPPCDIFIDLDNDNSSFGFRGDHCVDTFCVPPVMVSDTDVVIFSASGMVESVTLQLEGMLDIGEEHLTVGMANNITVTGDGTPFLTLENNGNATVADFEEAVGTVLYDNSAVATTFGMRRVLVTAFAAGESSLVSVAELPLSNERMRTVAVTTDPTCHGLSDGSIGVSSEGGVGQYLYQWEIPQQGDSVEDLSAGIYPFVVTDSLGCTKRDTVFLHDPDTLVADISYSGHYSICDSSGLLTATASGGSGGLSYSWDNGVTDSINTGVGAGDYTLTVQDTNGCTATAFHAIPFGPAVYETRYDTICENEPVLWYGDLFASDTFTCQAFLLENGCDSFHCLSLSVRPSPSATIITDGDFCETDEIALSVGNHEAYLWSTGGTDAQIDISDVGNYSVTVTNGYGCTASASIIIDPPISFDLMFKSPSCHGDRDGEIVFANTTGGSPPYLYSIDGGNQFHTDGQFGNLPAGGYGTVVTDADGCSMTTPVELVQPSAVTVEAGDDREIDLGEGIALDGFTNLADPVVAWHPTDGLDCPTCLQTDGRPFMSIQYVLEVVDSNGCTASDVVNVVVNDRSDTYAPNVFSPNGDGINDYFIVHTGTSITDVLSLKVFDRWGGTVFSAAGLIPNKIETGWPGAVKGEPAQEGVYVYIAELQKVNGEVEVVSGEVLLIR
jgi:gliding motility-associated-like protein